MGRENSTSYPFYPTGGLPCSCIAGTNKKPTALGDGSKAGALLMTLIQKLKQILFYLLRYRRIRFVGVLTAAAFTS